MYVRRCIEELQRLNLVLFNYGMYRELAWPAWTCVIASLSAALGSMHVTRQGAEGP